MPVLDTAVLVMLALAISVLARFCAEAGLVARRAKVWTRATKARRRG